MRSLRWPGAARLGDLWGGLVGFTAGPLGLGARISIFFGAIFLAYGVIVPYFPVWLHARGLTPIEISIVTAAPLFVRLLFTPAVLLLADRLAGLPRRHRRHRLELGGAGAGGEARSPASGRSSSSASRSC